MIFKLGRLDFRNLRVSVDKLVGELLISNTVSDGKELLAIVKIKFSDKLFSFKIKISSLVNILRTGTIFFGEILVLWRERYLKLELLLQKVCSTSSFTLVLNKSK
jgi:hypothetical protein